MDAPNGASGEPSASGLDALMAEAREALSHSSNTLRTVRDRFRDATAAENARWMDLRDDLAVRGREPIAPEAPPRAADQARTAAVLAAEVGAEDAYRRVLRAEVARLGTELGRRQAELGRIELAIANLEHTWLFLSHRDTTLVGLDGHDATAGPSIQMRIVEAQEAERNRLAQEVHDGPAAALANAIFRLEYLDRVHGDDPARVPTELRGLRDLLLRELGEVRTFISQLRPPLALEAGLEGALRDAAVQFEALVDVPVTLDLRGPADGLTLAEQTVALRIVQEALQNVRKHAAASSVVLCTAIEGDRWVAELRDDGRGFDVGAAEARGRRNFGLQFMRQRAELIGAEWEARSTPDGGTVVRLARPLANEEGT
jgi:two-component system sensor histidine kinase DegS